MFFIYQQPNRPCGKQFNTTAFANLHINNFYLHTSSIVIDRYSNFGNPYLSKEFTRVLVPGQIVTSLEHLAK